MNAEFNTIINQIIQSGTEASSVTNVQVKALAALFVKTPKIFSSCLINLIDRCLTFEAEDAYLRNFFRLLDRLYFEFLGNKIKANGHLILKSVIRHLVETANLPKLVFKI